MKVLLLSVLVCLLLYHEALGIPLEKRKMEPSTVVSQGGNSTAESPSLRDNSTEKVSRFNVIEKYMPTIKNVFIFVCGLSTFLILCLVIKIFRSGKRIRKTRKYDIITTPAERVEMAPLNDDNYEDEDATVFDIKYRYR
ncbi:membrane protein FAM174B isoform X2 [Xenopus laevis]|uniref:Membrane protein FAM174B isoform X2 n=1 Tax=Xenopus laevis TaxID=8355 RepID=A0A8J0URD9_XENLA|nr:membrane protein FAM174B isoform X2 [Xenopus laevis]